MVALPVTPPAPLSINLLSAALSFAWFIPGLVLGVPGFVLMLAVAAQLVGALAWLPAVRRSLGSFGVHRRRDASDSAG